MYSCQLLPTLWAGKNGKGGVPGNSLGQAKSEKSLNGLSVFQAFLSSQPQAKSFSLFFVWAEEGGRWKKRMAEAL